MKQFSMNKRKRKKFSTKKKYTDRYQTAKDIRGSQRWKDLRSAYRRENPLCQWCRNAPVEEIHHIAPVVEAPELAYEWDNLAALCEDCHDRIHTKMSRGESVEKEIKARQKEAGM